MTYPSTTALGNSVEGAERRTGLFIGWNRKRAALTWRRVYGKQSLSLSEFNFGGVTGFGTIGWDWTVLIDLGNWDPA